MEKKDDFNIFDEARKQLGKSKKKKRPRDPSQQESSAPKNPSPIAQSGNNLSASDSSPLDMIKKIREMDNDLQKKMEHICDLSGMSKKELDTYIENPQNFKTGAWLKAQSLKEKLEENFYEILGAQEKKKNLQKKKLKLSKDRRGKTLGGRKGWLQM